MNKPPHPLKNPQIAKEEERSPSKRKDQQAEKIDILERFQNGLNRLQSEEWFEDDEDGFGARRRIGFAPSPVDRSYHGGDDDDGDRSDGEDEEEDEKRDDGFSHPSIGGLTIVTESYPECTASPSPRRISPDKTNEDEDEDDDEHDNDFNADDDETDSPPTQTRTPTQEITHLRTSRNRLNEQLGNMVELSTRQMAQLEDLRSRLRIVEPNARGSRLIPREDVNVLRCAARARVRAFVPREEIIEQRDWARKKFRLAVCVLGFVLAVCGVYFWWVWYCQYELMYIRSRRRELYRIGDGV